LEHYLPGGPVAGEMDAAVTKAMRNRRQFDEANGSRGESGENSARRKDGGRKGVERSGARTGCEIGLAKADEVATASNQDDRNSLALAFSYLRRDSLS